MKLLNPIRIFIIAGQAVLAFFVSYLLMLTAAARRAPKKTAVSPTTSNHFLLLIPAHNEEKLLPRLLNSLANLNYPNDHYTVHVVADNCTDQTAECARAAGATVHERFNEVDKGKGYALQWFLDELWQRNDNTDAIVILDADTVVSPNFLQVMNTRLEQGERVIQAYYTVENPENSVSAELRYIALALLHFLRPQGRMVLGGSAGLKGNGMVFAADIMRNHTWSDSVTEDIELHMELLLSGERVTFTPDAIVKAEMPDQLADARSQNVRWEQGRLAMAQKYIPPLFNATRTNIHQPRKAFVFFDAIMEHAIPPFSVLAGLTGLSLLTSLFWQVVERKGNMGKLSLALSMWAIIGQFVYTFAGLILVDAPRSTYRVFLHAPKYVVWKIWHYVRILFGLEKHDNWVRTARNAE